jgi:hypothetical protein
VPHERRLGLGWTPLAAATPSARSTRAALPTRAPIRRELSGSATTKAESAGLGRSSDMRGFIVRLDPLEADHGPAAGVASIVDELRHQVPARYEGHEFPIGTPYPDRDRQHLAGGILFIDERTFQNATLSTFDGNEYFSISITTRCVNILVQDVDSTYP